MDAQMKALEATSKFQVALIKEDYEAGKITLEQYIAFVKTAQGKITENQITAARIRIEETNKEYQAKKISADEMKTKISVIEQEIVVIRQNAISEYHTFEKNATEEAVKQRDAIQKEGFNRWRQLRTWSFRHSRPSLILKMFMMKEPFRKGCFGSLNLRKKTDTSEGSGGKRNQTSRGNEQNVF